MQQPHPSPDWRFAIALTLLFAVTCGILNVYHEPWRDEMQAWLLARDSASIPVLLAHLKYEGHPPLWHTCLFLLQRVSSNPAVMQSFNWLLATGAVALVALYAPFGRLPRALFAFGYFPLYMYGTVARDYALTLLLIVGACVLFPRRRTRFLALVLTLCFLTQTSVFGLIVAIVLAAALVVERAPRHRFFWPGVGLVALAVGLTVLQLRPPADSGFGTGWHLGLERKRVVALLVGLAEAFVPVQHPAWGFWSRPLIHYWRTPRVLGIGFALALAAWMVVGLARHRLMLAIYVAATSGLLTFFYVKYPGELNHHGFLFVVFVAALWLFLAEPTDAPVRPSWWDATVGPVLTLVLLIQAIAAVPPAWMDLRTPFSNGRATAAFLRQPAYADDLLVAHRDATAASVLGFLPGRQAFFPAPRRFGTFTVWDTLRLEPVTDAEIVRRADSLGTARGRRVILVLDHPLDSMPALAQFTGSYVRDEDYYLYLVGEVR